MLYTYIHCQIVQINLICILISIFNEQNRAKNLALAWKLVFDNVYNSKTIRRKEKTI